MARRHPRLVVACDKFKGSLTAAEVADGIARGVRRVAPDAEIAVVPVADGGDGTLDAALSAGFTRVAVTVPGPTGEPVDTAYALRDGVAVVEMADACGLLRLPGGELAPMTASSRGLGVALAAALADGAREIVLGVGGSASTDGGAGMLAALGARFLDAAGEDLPDGGGALAALTTVDLSGLSTGWADVSVVLATDVQNPLLGPQGAPSIFAPQKGASEAQLAELEDSLTHYARLVTEAAGVDARGLPGAGAAGGVGFAALGVLGATMRPGVEIVLGWSGFDTLVADADLVVTGEGSLDRQTLLGKTPAGVAAAAQRAGVPVVAVCGRSLLTPDELTGTGIQRVYALTDIEPDPAISMRDAGRLITDLAAAVAKDWLLGPSNP